MTPPFRNSTENRKLLKLARAIGNDIESYVQLLLSACSRQTFARIVHCPTYPVYVMTRDLEERLQIFKDLLSENSVETPYILAYLFERAKNEQKRKKVGQYFTPQKVANKIINLVDLKSGEIILDAGSGTGIFAQSIFTQNFDQVKKIRYLGVETDPLLALSTAFSLERIGAPENWRVAYSNFLFMTSDELKKLGYRRIDVIVANPPFVRSNRLGKRKRIAKQFGLSGFAGLHSFFLYHAARIMDDGRMAFILPLEMTRTRYGYKLLKSLKERFDIEIINHNGENSYSTASKKNVTETQEILVKPQASLFIFRSRTKFKKEEELIEPESEFQNIQLRNFASVHRGISTGANKFFLLNADMIEEIGVPDTFLIKIMPTKLKRNEMADIFNEEDWCRLKESGKRCFLLNIPSKNQFMELPNSVKQYLRLGEQQGVHLVPTCKNRKDWYSVRLPDAPPDFIFTYMFRGYPKFIHNTAGVYALTNLLGVYLKKHIVMSKKETMKLTHILNASIIKWIDAESPSRMYSGGLSKLEPRDLERMPVSRRFIDSIKGSLLDTLYERLEH